MMPTYAPADFVPVRGQGAMVWDQAGRDYVDFGGGVAVLSVGHNHPAVMAALTAQAQKIWHVSNWMTNEPALRLARKLVDNTFAERVFLCNSGTEANEGALKTARKYAAVKHGEHKYGIVSTKNSFHGRTLFAVNVGGSPKYTQGYGPALPGITHVTYNSVEELRAAVNANTAAVILEPMQGEGGMLPATPAFLKAARELCDQHGALLIFDEIQSGMGRTGALFSYQQKGITPDILTSAKGLGGGFPIGAFMTTAEIASVMQPGSHGSTYGGNPLACAVAESVFDLINNADVLQGVLDKTQRFHDRLHQINAAHQVFTDVRGEGLWIGAELVPALAARGGEAVKLGHEHGLIMLTAGGGNILRFAPSLLISNAEIDLGLDRLEQTLIQLKATA
jgi:succinylornithine aminotransferase